MLIFLFWLFAVLIFYTYAGYPLLLLVWARMFAKPVRKENIEPAVSVILSAFNEEKHIERKLSNLLELDYPAEKIEILVGSDGADDRTDSIISRFESNRIRFFRFVKNLGKPHVLSALVKEAHGEILVFTDARQELDSLSVRRLVSNFADPSVGCVSGELYFNPEGTQENIGKGMDAYWKYEKLMRKKESEIGSMLGATGAIYAVCRRLFPKLPADILVDDMFIPLSIVDAGARAVFEAEAHAYDQASSKGKQEFVRKVRTLTGNYQIFNRLPKLMIPGKSPVAVQLISHKLFRLLVPFFLVGFFLSSLFLAERPFFGMILLAQLFFYGLAIWQAASEKAAGNPDAPPKALGGKQKAFFYIRKAASIAYTFCLLNYAALVGLIQYLKIANQKVSAQKVWKKAYV